VVSRIVSVRRVLVPLVAVAALVAGCGSSVKTAGPEGGAAVAPRSTSFLLRLNTAFDSAQWTTLDRLLPGLDPAALFAGIAGSGVSFDRDVRPALGPETDLAALTADDVGKGTFFGLTQPKNPAKLDSLLAKGGGTSVSEEIAGWRVIAESRPTIDRIKRARNEGSLAGDASFKEATAGLPAESLATLYVTGDVLTSALDKRLKTGTGPVPGLGRVAWLAGAVSAKEHGLALDVRVKGDEITATPFVAELPAEVPADVSLLVDFKGLDSTLEQLKRSPALSGLLGPAAKALGGVLDDAIALFRGEGAFYVRSGTPTEYTLLLKVADEASARATLDRLATLVSAFLQEVPEPVQIAGIDAKKLTIGKVTLYYAVVDGKLVISSAESGIGLLRQGPRLADVQAWRNAKEAAGMPSETTGIVYADVRTLVPIVEQLTKKPLPADAKRSLAPLRTALLYGSVDGSILSVKGFVSVR
jgi:hypothetical protein